MEIVKRSDDMKGFVVLPRPLVVKRTFSWFGLNQRLAKDFANLAVTLATFVTLPPSNSPSRGLPRSSSTIADRGLYYGSRRSILKDRRKEIGVGLLRAMLRQLGLTPRDLE
jgi:hypothetical protein